MNKIALLALATGLLASQPARAFNPQPDPPGCGMIGLIAGETARINVANPEGEWLVHHMPKTLPSADARRCTMSRYEL